MSGQHSRRRVGIEDPLANQRHGRAYYPQRRGAFQLTIIPTERRETLSRR